MALRTFVKISQVNNLSDARYCAGMGVAMLGFNLEPGTLHYVAPEKFRELSEWVAGVGFAAEFTDADPATIKRLLPEYPVDYLQTDKAEYLEELHRLELPLILRIVVNAGTDPNDVELLLTQFQQQVAFFLLEAEDEITANNSLFKSLLSFGSKYELIADFGFEADSISGILEQYPLKGIALKGGEEIRAGYKDFDALADILEALEVDEAY
jgi:phosphoribosylanthranilate isomerase